MALVLNGSNDTITGLQINSSNIVDGSIVNADVNASAAIAASKLSGISAGKILQVVSTTKSDGFSTTSSSFVDITGLSRTITPTAASSKIHIVVSVHCGGAVNAYLGFLLLVGSTVVSRGPASGSITRCTFSTQFADPDSTKTPCYTHLHSPSYSVGDTLTYKLQVLSGYSSNRVTINTVGRDPAANASYSMNGTSTITLMEVAA
tara:strand:- start:329 stop:943 length:615 start_codon:yes stop_codon:yes gene_type:complete